MLLLLPGRYYNIIEYCYCYQGVITIFHFINNNNNNYYYYYYYYYYYLSTLSSNILFTIHDTKSSLSLNIL